MRRAPRATCTKATCFRHSMCGRPLANGACKYTCASRTTTGVAPAPNTSTAFTKTWNGLDSGGIPRASRAREQPSTKPRSKACRKGDSCTRATAAANSWKQKTPRARPAKSFIAGSVSCVIPKPCAARQEPPWTRLSLRDCGVTSKYLRRFGVTISGKTFYSMTGNRTTCASQFLTK